MRIPHTSRAHWPVSIAPGRFAASIDIDVSADSRVAILGIPDDTGVRMNGGRPGAAAGPRAFRAALARFGVDQGEGWEYPKVCDAGDIIPGANLHETHARVTEAASVLLDMGLLPVAIGGGHDLTFPFARAAVEKAHVRSGVYFDAHLDVRETLGSGMPFRRLLEDCGVTRLVNVGADRLVNSREHWRYFESRNGRVGRFDPEPWPALDGNQFLSFDLDVLDASIAPGVSAMNPSGMDVETAARYIHAAGRSPLVRCFDIMELSPPHDHPSPDAGRTARVAAYLFLTFLRGVSERHMSQVVF